MPQGKRSRSQFQMDTAKRAMDLAEKVSHLFSSLFRFVYS
jgi:ribosomal protein S10